MSRSSDDQETSALTVRGIRRSVHSHSIFHVGGEIFVGKEIAPQLSKCQMMCDSIVLPHT